MYVVCPHCESLFQVQAAHLQAAQGMVRCGVCQNTFDAASIACENAEQALARHSGQNVAEEIDELVDRALQQLPGADPTEVTTTRLAEPSAPTVAEQSPQEPELRVVIRPSVSPGRPRVRADWDAFAQPSPVEFAMAEVAPVDDWREPVGGPIYAEEMVGDRHSMRIPWGGLAASVALVLVLIAQYAYVERDQLAASPQLRPALETYCEVLGCDLPLLRDVEQVEMVRREVRQHPNVTDALLISAAFVNRAEFAQPYPLFQVSFSDVSGTQLAVRRFRPEEYLGNVDSATSGMQPGEMARLTLELIDPGSSAVSYQFEFL